MIENKVNKEWVEGAELWEVLNHEGYNTRQFFVKADDKGLRASHFVKAHFKGLRGAGSALESTGARKPVKADLKGLTGEAGRRAGWRREITR